MHQPHGFIAQLIGMIDGGHTGSNGIKRAGLARGVDGNAFAHPRGFADRGAEFGFRILIGRGELAIPKRVFAGFVDLDEVRAFLDLPANDGHEFGGIIGISSVRKDALFGIVSDRIFVPANDGNRVPADPQTRTWDQTLIDCIAHGGVRSPGAFGAHVAFRRIPGHEICAGSQRGHDGSLRRRFLNRLQILGARMQK